MRCNMGSSQGEFAISKSCCFIAASATKPLFAHFTQLALDSLRGDIKLTQKQKQKLQKQNRFGFFYQKIWLSSAQLYKLRRSIAG